MIYLDNPDLKRHGSSSKSRCPNIQQGNRRKGHIAIACQEGAIFRVVNGSSALIQSWSIRTTRCGMRSALTQLQTFCTVLRLRELDRWVDRGNSMENACPHPTNCLKARHTNPTAFRITGWMTDRLAVLTGVQLCRYTNSC
jgi:hypothetical protein